MDHLACVDVPAFPLQLLLQDRPEWTSLPAAVVSQDTPQGTILWVNERARRLGVLAGLRYAAGLSIASDLRASVVPETVIAEGVAFLSGELQNFSPEVEPSKEFPGVFWLNAGGLGRLYPSLLQWADAICGGLRKLGFRATVVVGFSRFGTYALARSQPGTRVLPNLAREKWSAREVLLERLDLEPDIRDALRKLGVVTVGSFLDLPADGIRQCFGLYAYNFHKLAAGELWTPFQPERLEDPLERHILLDDVTGDTHRLLFIIKQLLHPLLTTLAKRSQALIELTLLLTLDTVIYDGFMPDKPRPEQQRAVVSERIRPASPTLDGSIILDLVRLRLDAMRLASGVIEITLAATGVPATQAQLQLFAQNPNRDLKAANRAVARVRAELGDSAVVRAELRDGHLPEATFEWRPLDTLVSAQPRSVLSRPLVRRIYATPISLPSQSKYVRNDGWLVQRLEQGPVVEAAGPYIVSGGWWISPIHREYHYVRTERGDLLWIYYDRRRRRWFLHGQVE